MLYYDTFGSCQRECNCGVLSENRLHFLDFAFFDQLLARLDKGVHEVSGDYIGFALIQVMGVTHVLVLV